MPETFDANRDDLAAFIDGLFRYADDGTYVSWRAFRDDTKDAPPVFIHGTLVTPDHAELVDIAVGAATDAANRPERAVFCPPIATFANQMRAREIDLANGLALSVECDDNAEAARATLERLLGPATIVVASGGLTAAGDAKLHLHWRLTEPTSAPDEHARLKRARILATAIVGGDATNVPAVHPIRWPGSWHRKGEARIARIVAQDLDREISLTDALEQLEAAAPTRSSSQSVTSHQVDGEFGATTGTLITQLLSGEAIHAPLVALAYRYLKGGMSDAQCVLTLRGIMDGMPLALRNRPDAPQRWDGHYKDIPRTVHTAREKLGDLTPGAPVDLTAFNASVSAPAPDVPPLAKAPPLADVLDDVANERQDGVPEDGAVPLPANWPLVRAVYGGARQRDLIEATEPNGRAYLPRFDRALRNGYLSAGLHVFVGHTGGAKTALATNMLLAAAAAGHPIVYVSLELDRPELAARVVALQAGISWSDLALRRPLAPHDRRLRDAAINDVRAPLALAHVWAPDPGPDDPMPTAVQVRTLVYEAWRTHQRTPLVVFDYLQAPGFFGKDPDDERRLALRERIGVITMQLRHLSKMHTLVEEDGVCEEWPGCPVLVLSTTARSNVRGVDSPTGMSGEDPDLLRHDFLEILKSLPKEAGEIENTSVSLWAMSLESTEDYERRLTLRLAKNRRGPTGQWIPMMFDGVTGRIEEHPARYEQARLQDLADEAARIDAGRKSRKGARSRVELDIPSILSNGGTPSLDLLEESTRRGGAA